MSEGKNIAIIGMGCRFPPHLQTPQAYWDFVAEKKAAFTKVSQLKTKRWDLHGSNDYTAAYLEQIYDFDAHFFHVLPRKAENLDPQQRILLETIWHALEDAHYKASDFRGEGIGVFIGASSNDYHLQAAREGSKPNAYTAISGSLGMMAGKIASFYDWQGPATVFDATCSSSLVAIHYAISSLYNGDCHTAVVGGVSLLLSDYVFDAFKQAGFIKSDGICRPFDENSQGMLRGEGCGVLLLKLLEKAQKDGDHIHAVITASAISHNRTDKNFIAPQADAQANIIKLALGKVPSYNNAITYHEGQGTGNKSADMVELQGIKQAFSTVVKNDKLFIGSHKANIGHLDAAAGMASVIKVVLALQKQKIPPINVSELISQANMGSNYIFPEVVQDWPEGRSHTAGVSSFGINGTNAYLVLQDYHEQSAKEQPHDTPSDTSILLRVSAPSLQSLKQQVVLLQDYFKYNAHADLLQVAQAYWTGRECFAYQFLLICEQHADIVAILESIDFNAEQEKHANTIYCYAQHQVCDASQLEAIVQNFPHEWFDHFVKCFSGITRVAQKIPRHSLPAVPLYAFYRRQYKINEHHASVMAPHDEGNAIEGYCQALFGDLYDQQASWFQMGADSLDLLQISHFMETTYNVHIAVHELFSHFQNPGQLRSLIQEASLTPHGEKQKQQLSLPHELAMNNSQQSFWIFHKFNPSMRAINIVSAKIINRMPFKQEIFTQSCDESLSVHILLRCKVDIDNPIFHVQEYPSLVVTVHSLIDTEKSQQLAAIQEIEEKIQSDNIGIFDFPLYKFYVVLCNEQEWILYTLTHHIVLDGWSQLQLVQEILGNYQIMLQGKQPQKYSDSYLDYIRWHKHQLEQQELLEKAQKYFRNLLEDIIFPPSFMQFPLAHETFSFDTGFQSLPVLKSELPQLSFIRSDFKSTNMQYFLFVWLVLIAKLGQQEEVLCKVDIAGQIQARMPMAIGNCLLTIPIRQKFTQTLSSDFQSLINQFLASFNYAAFFTSDLYQSEMLDMNTEIFFNSIFNYIKLYKHIDVGLSSSQFEPFLTRQLTIPLEFIVFETEDRYLFVLRYNQCTFDKESIDWWLKSYAYLVYAIPDNFDQPHTTINLFDGELQQELLRQYYQGPKRLCEETNFMTMLTKQARNNPDGIAFYDGEQSITFKQAIHVMGCVGAFLERKGVGERDVIGLCADRNSEYWLSFLSIMVYGGCVVPIEVNTAKMRFAAMCEEAGIKTVFYTNAVKNYIDTLQDSHSPVTFQVFDEQIFNENDNGELLAMRQDNASGSHILFTTGSMGALKKAEIHTQAMVNHLYAKMDILELGNHDCIAETADYGFNVSIWQALLGPLFGASTYIVPSHIANTPLDLITLLQTKSISILEVVPNMLRALLKELETVPVIEFKALRMLVVAGEILHTDICTQWLSLYPHINIINAYGPTECSIDVSHFVQTSQIKPKEPILPVGKPIRNATCYIMNQYQKLLPPGCVGELCIGGDTVGFGYVGQAAKKQSSFVPDPYNLGKLIYKTGDLAKILPDGNIVVLGRFDSQIQPHGFQIELVEIESYLRRHPYVKNAIVRLYSPTPNRKKLIAWVISKISQDILQHYLRKALPDYMIPKQFFYMDIFPLDSHGKLDEKKLPLLDQVSCLPDQVAESKAEMIIQQIVAEMLFIEKPSMNDHFFKLGANSLMLMRLIASLQKQFSINMDVTQLRKDLTLKGIAGYLEQCVIEQADQDQVDSYIESL